MLVCNSIKRYVFYLNNNQFPDIGHYSNNSIQFQDYFKTKRRRNYHFANDIYVTDTQHPMVIYNIISKYAQKRMTQLILICEDS